MSSNSGIIIFDSLRVSKNAHPDAKIGVYENGIWRPFSSKAEACQLIDINERHDLMVIPIIHTGTDEPIDYWFRGGVEDADLVIKNNWVYLTINADGHYTQRAETFVQGVIVKPLTGSLAAFKLGTTPGGDDISLAGAYAQNVNMHIGFSSYTEVDFNIYFSGLAGVNTKLIILRQ